MIGTPRLCKCMQCKMVHSENAFPFGLDGRRSGKVCTRCLRPAEKKCSGCNVVKPIRNFSADYGRSDLHAVHCKTCQRNSRERNRHRRDGVRGFNPRVKSAEQAKVRDAAMLAQKRDPDAPYFERYRGVEGPLVFGCVKRRVAMRVVVGSKQPTSEVFDAVDAVADRASTRVA